MVIFCHLYAPTLFSEDPSTEQQLHAATARRRHAALKARKSGLDVVLLESFPTMTVAQARTEDAQRELVRLQWGQEMEDEGVEKQPVGCVISLGRTGKKNDSSELTTPKEGVLAGYGSGAGAAVQGMASVVERCADVEAVSVRARDAAGERECVVCLGEFGDEEIVRRLPRCSHWFHTGCIDQWLMSKSTCPLCRTSMKQEEQAGEKEAEGGAEGGSASVVDVVAVMSSSQRNESSAVDPCTLMHHVDGEQ